MYNCIIIDDEQFAIDYLNEQIDAIPGFSVLKAYTDPMLAIDEMINGDEVDVILLDIEMPSISGIALASQLRHKTKKLVFISAHTKYGFAAFEVQADAFLQKPFSLAQFAITLRRLFPDRLITKTTEQNLQHDFFFVKNKEDQLKWTKIAFSEIIMIEGSQNYVRISTTQDKIITYLTLAEIKSKLDHRPEFIQVHRSFIVSTNFIEKIDRKNIETTLGHKVSIGEAYRKTVQNYLSLNLLKSKRERH